MNNLPALKDYGLKKTFLDALDNCTGNTQTACSGLGIDLDFLDRMCEADDIFKEAVEQIQYEHSASAEGDPCVPTRMIGIRPFDLQKIIETRLSELPQPPEFGYDTAARMCRFLGFFRGIGWDTKGACDLAKVSTLEVRRWVNLYPEFKELYDSAQRDSLEEVFDSAVKRALDPTPSGDIMRSLVLRGKGKLIGFDVGGSKGTQVNVNVQRSPEESDAINHAHQKAVEAAANIITIEST